MECWKQPGTSQSEPRWGTACPSVRAWRKATYASAKRHLGKRVSKNSACCQSLNRWAFSFSFWGGRLAKGTASARSSTKMPPHAIQRPVLVKSCGEDGPAEVGRDAVVCEGQCPAHCAFYKVHTLPVWGDGRDRMRHRGCCNALGFSEGSPLLCSPRAPRPVQMGQLGRQLSRCRARKLSSAQALIVSHDILCISGGRSRTTYHKHMSARTSRSRAALSSAGTWLQSSVSASSHAGQWPQA